MKIVVGWLFLVIFWWLGEVIGVGEVKIKEGIIFEKSGRVKFYDGQHAVVLMIKKDGINHALATLRMQLTKLQEVKDKLPVFASAKLENLKERGSHMKHREVVNSCVEMLEDAVNRVSSKWDQFESVVQPRRVERNILGQVAGYLFGLSTTDQVKKIQSQIYTHMHQQDVVLTKVLGVIKKRGRAMLKLVGAVKKFRDFINKLADRLDFLVERMENIDEWTLVHAQSANLGFHVMQVVEGVESLISELRSVMNVGKIVPELVDPEFLLTVLDGLVREGISIPYPADREHIFNYYSLAKATVHQTSDYIMIIAKFPINIAHPVFNLFRVESLWITSNGPWARRVKLDRGQIAITPGGGWAADVPLGDECSTIQDELFCPHTRDWARPESGHCMLNVFRGLSGNSSGCQYSLTLKFRTIVRRFGNFLIINTNQPERWDVERGSESKTDTRIIPRGINKIRLEGAEEIKGKGMKIKIMNVDTTWMNYTVEFFEPTISFDEVYERVNES